MKKKLFLLGFTVEGFEQTGGVDSVIDVDGDEEDFEEDEKAEENQTEGHEGTQGDHISDGSGGGDLAIDELDKANFSSKQNSSRKSDVQGRVDAHMEDNIDTDQEDFILEYAVTKVNSKGSSSDGHGHASGYMCRLTDQDLHCEDRVGDAYKTPVPKGKTINTNPESNTENMNYCEDLLRSVDMHDSEDEGIEGELGVLPPEAVQILQSETWKRSLLESLSQAKNGEAVQENKSRGGPIVATRPATRGHGNINIMEKAAAYKRKKNLEIPPTFKGKSFSTMDKNILANQMSQMNFVIRGDDNQKNLTIDEMIEVEKERCLVFANNNPEIVLPNNLDLDPSELVRTPDGVPPGTSGHC